MLDKAGPLSELSGICVGVLLIDLTAFFCRIVPGLFFNPTPVVLQAGRIIFASSKSATGL